MHLSYRGNVYQGSFDGSSKTLRRLEGCSGECSPYQSLAGIIEEFFYRIFRSLGEDDVTLSGRFWGNLSERASTCFMTNRSFHGTSSQFEHEIGSEFDERLYHMERSLQLAYAVGDRPLIRKLEAEIESFTGWRFQRERTWLSQ